MSHNTEAEACDLLMEIEHMDMLLEFVDVSVYKRVCLYLSRLELISVSPLSNVAAQHYSHQ